MCGINGIIHASTSEQPSTASLEKMNEALRHRGPDDGGIWTNGPAGLAARRLSIRDVDHGHQPMVSEDERFAVAFNGEIYNYDECRSELEAKGHVFRTRCDTELLLRGYEAWGDALPERLNGMFAFAAYDTQRQRLFIARDRLGIKPLFYTHTNGILAFSSELTPLRESQWVNNTLNPAALDDYFTFLYIPTPNTIYKEVYKLPPASTLVFEKGQLSITRYWKPDYTLNPNWTLDSASERFTELFRDAVRIRRVSDVPLGAFLSGGLDSSAVVGALANLSDSPVQTFSIGFDHDEANELPYARAVAEAFGTEHTEEIVHADACDLAQTIAPYFGEPFADSSAIPMWHVAQTARRSVAVALSGDGGDELFAGYSWAHMHRRVRQYASLPKWIRRFSDQALRFGPNSPFVNKLRRFSSDSFLPNRDAFQRRLTCFSVNDLHDLYQPEAAKRLTQWQSDAFDKIADSAPPMSDDDWMLYQDQNMYLPDDILTKVDRMTMAHSLEARVPFLDHRLVEFAATVPFDLKYKGGISKRLVKHALRDTLPESATAQRKRGFSIPIDHWFRTTLYDLFADTVLAPNAKCAAYLNVDTVAHLANSHRDGKENRGHQLWAILMFEQWLRTAKAD